MEGLEHKPRKDNARYQNIGGLNCVIQTICCAKSKAYLDRKVARLPNDFILQFFEINPGNNNFESKEFL